MRAAREALTGAGLWRDGAVLLCAVSGGCDSAAMLHALSRLRAEKALRVCAVHVQHGLRGEESLRDERFVQALCEALQVPLTVENAGLHGDMHTPGMETLARERRRELFAQRMQALGADALITAHHLDDQAETVLMHLLRGSGMHGLCGMQTVSSFGERLLIRPFLSIPKARLRDALAAEGLPFCEDGSNLEPVTPRNALRLTILPQLETLFPGISGHLAQTAEALKQDEQCLNVMADALYASAAYVHAPLFMLALPPLAAAPEAIRRRVLRRWYAEGLAVAGISAEERSLSHADTLALSALAAAPAGTSINLPNGLLAAREKDWLHLLRQTGEPLCTGEMWRETVEPVRCVYALPHMTLESAAATFLPRDPCSVILPPDWLARRPVLRTPEPEDIIHPFGAPGHKPLRRFLTDHKIDPLLRRAWPVLCDGHEVLWCPGLAASEKLRLAHIPSGSLQLTITGCTPFLPNQPKE